MPYIENLCFKLNHSPEGSGNGVSMKLNSGVRTGLELRAPSLKIDPERLISELQGFVQGLKNISKSDQSRLIKTKIQSIKYSKKSLRVNFYYPFKPNALTSFQSSSKEAEKSSCARVVSFEDKTNQPRPVSRSELVRNEKMAPRAGLEPAARWLQVTPMFPSGLDYLFTMSSAKADDLGSGCIVSARSEASRPRLRSGLACHSPS